MFSVRERPAGAIASADEPMHGNRSMLAELNLALNTLPALLRSAISWLASIGRVRKQIISVAMDSLLALFALWAAFSIRLGEFYLDIASSAHLFLLIPPVTAAVFAGLGVYRWMVRSSNFRLCVQLAKGAVLTGLILLATMYLFPPAKENPRSLFIIFALLVFFGTAGCRLIWRRVFDAGQLGVPIAIYGAGSAGVQLAYSLAAASEYRPVCFIDDARELSNTTLAGLPVIFGRSDKLQEKLHQLEASEVVVAMPSLSFTQYAALLERLVDIGIPFKTLPGVAELLSGRANLDEIREISINDILGRSEVPADPNLMRQCVAAQSIVVTGGGGSIGSELCRQIITLKPSRLTIIDNCEANLYHITEEIESLLAGNIELQAVEFRPILCSVCDAGRIREILESHPVDAIFHAAAYKHVPIVERFPMQGIDVNIGGTLTMVDAAIAANVDRFVLISTDKAVRPANAMGATKRIAELVLQARACEKHHTTISMVRFGNVLGSSGSVVPKFFKQIESGGPLTLTHKAITRYFMTIPEAAQLVMQASTIARGGDVFVLDMGEPVRILDLAENMIRLHQHKRRLAGLPHDSIQIVETGLRPGEKMHEELFESAGCQVTDVNKVLMANEAMMPWSELNHRLTRLFSSGDRSAQEIKAQLLGLLADIPPQRVSGIGRIVPNPVTQVIAEKDAVA